jgi:hypothetical protein
MHDARSDAHSVATAANVVALAAAAAAQASLTELQLRGAPLYVPGALDAVVDAALALRVSSVQLSGCQLSPACAPALARLLRGDALTELTIQGGSFQLLDEPGAALIAVALRATTRLTALSLEGVWLFYDGAAAAHLMGALTGPWLRVLNLSQNHQHNEYGGGWQARVGAALRALLLANAPALQTLHIHGNRLYDAGMGPVVEALRHNTHLTQLDCHDNVVSEHFAREQLLPAVRANGSLRQLVAAGRSEGEGAAYEAAALVAARARAQSLRALFGSCTTRG